MSEELILAWLRFEGGALRPAQDLPASGGGIVLELGIGHPAMPPVGEGEAIPIVDPEYRAESITGCIYRASVGRL